jgi:para-nitrobenzyl esterase
MIESAVAETSVGTIEGRREGDLLLFRGIRYGEPPTGPLRFRAPVPVESWSGTRSAVDYGPAPHQFHIAEGLLIPESASELNAPEGEDCLSVNVVTPGTDGRRPVMVYIHGGNFVEGAGSQQWSEPSPLVARGDVVAVNVNYRLGPLGWLFLGDLAPDASADDNIGLRDQIAALEWVRENIEALGGDPDNVTLYGYSAGAWSISALMAAGCAPRLFQRAILMSGGVRCHTRDEATRLTERILAELQISPDDLDPLWAIDAEDFTPALAAVWDAEGHPFPPIRPVTDGQLVPDEPLAAIAAGSASGLKTIVGSTLDEFKLVATVDHEAAELDEAGVEGRFADLGAETAARIVRAYRTARDARGEPVTPADLYWAVESDRMFSVPGVRVAEAQSTADPDTWMYQVRWKAGDPRLGACHAVDLSLMFGGLDLPGMEVLSGTSREAHRLSEQIMDAWTTFARLGSPNHEGLPPWPRYDVERRATMVFDAPCSVVDAPLGEERMAWKDVL